MVVLVAEIPLISKIPELLKAEERVIEPDPLKAREPVIMVVVPVYVLAAAKVNLLPLVFISEPPVPENTPDAIPSEPPWIIVNDFDPRDTAPAPL
jgi:hypothetical protein